ncbi:MAG: hypothetical protein MK193_09240 [Lentisphaeria bacterium]|nr:hypothetical protein [Lentisphaeria bacterium]
MSEQLDNKELEQDENAATASVVRLLRVFFSGMSLLMVLMIVLYFLSGFHIVGSDEQALHFRFGKLIGIRAPDNWYFSWPRPFGEVYEKKVKQQRTYNCEAFWYPTNEKNVLSGNTGPSATESMKPGEGGYLLTGDTNIIHQRWSIVYHIGELDKYYKNFNEPEQLLEALLRNAILEETASLTIKNVFEGSNENLRASVFINLQNKIAKLQPGLTIDQLNYLQKETPLGTKEAFQDVTNASQERSSMVYEAESYEKQLLHDAVGEKERILSDALTYEQRLKSRLAAKADYLVEIHPQFSKYGFSLFMNQYHTTIQNTLERAENIIVAHPEQELRLTIQPLLKALKPDASEQ